MKPPYVYVLTPIVAACIVNAIIYTRGWQNNSVIERSPLLPPGYIIASVWIVLLGLLGYAYYLSSSAVSKTSIVIMVLYCLAYPFATAGLRMNNSRLLNTITLIMVALLLPIVSAFDIRALKFIIPLWAWASFVNITDALQ